MSTMPPGGIFRREARWMLWLVVVPALVALTLALIVPWIARGFR